MHRLPVSDQETTTQPRLSLNTITIRHASLEDKFRLAAETGFQGLELWGYEVDQDVSAGSVRALAADHGLAIEGICPQPDLYRWHCSWDRELEELLRQRCAFYQEIGARYLVMPVMNSEGSDDQLVANLARAAVVGASFSLTMALEPIGHVAKLASFAKALAVLAQVGETATGIVLDVFHFYRGRNDLATLAQVDPDRVAAVHLDDALALPLDELVGYRHRAYPGAGMFDVQGFCSAVAATGFPGPYVVELLNEQYWQEDPRTVARTAYAAARRVLLGAGVRSLS
jgi:sugar phosphate isomerase/epimerase